MASPAPSSLPETCILLVEDHAPNALVVGIFLEEFGYSYDVAENGLAALNRFQEKTYQVILMDIDMPEINGYEATAHIREIENQTGRPRTCIIGMTAHALSDDRDKCLGAGMDDYIAKPFKPDELEEKLGKFCKSAA
ncbi:MAG TPA: response regulator [Alphaproteobacteria bacterium]|nr:hypothetical protein [Rhodospirillaceae bacterium]HRJ12085.1 response regulator [Alphaproteobacteria bacterium]